MIASVVHALTDMRKQVADRDAALAVIPELPGAAEHVADVVELRRVGLDLDRLPVLAVETWLGVERVHLRWPAVHEQEDDARGLGRKVRGLWAPADLSPTGWRAGTDSAGASPRAPQTPASERATRGPATQTRRPSAAACLVGSVQVRESVRSAWRFREARWDRLRIQSTKINSFILTKHMTQVGPGEQFVLVGPVGLACRPFICGRETPGTRAAS